MSHFSFNDKSGEQLKEIASVKLKNAYGTIGKVNPDEQSPARQARLRRMIGTSLTISGWKPGDILDVDWEKGIPRFFKKS
jgi:hypothetical protein